MILKLISGLAVLVFLWAVQAAQSADMPRQEDRLRVGGKVYKLI